MNLKTQKRLAADILGVGENRVWIDPDRVTEVSTAITRADIRSLIKDDAIKAKPKKSTSKARVRKHQKQVQKGLRKGSGSRKGAKGARTPKKEAWKKRVRALRRRLRELRDQGTIDSSRYRKLYRMVEGGSFRSKAHLESYLKKRGILEE
ncbi:50S ribosomal protein L19 [candidate division MSBL1 archaeon SCGC-AAA261F19]|uniref:Large ribosomal subunit protein eL19 n=2 Tax=candidate division MSBL1 TaxID=215777 RepID=A0A133V987_9EURY|nr:50S ribosomal protein L19 [candidate division MSBL1 archaeon SCGC-AAA261F19]KXB04485.1 50S ribosomal protein L19 [candidate division MSBL1 archaeon SCGC-AAA261O19]